MITTLEIGRDDRSNTRVVQQEAQVGDGQVLARIDHFSLTSNNITYSIIGHMMGYWDFFPPADEGWGRVPAFGHADIVESRCAGVEEGTRIYGYFPMASHVVLEPGRINPHSFHDMAEHRQPMSEVYNRYAVTATDPLHVADREEQRMLLHPLFMTSFVIDDFLADNDDFGASVAVVSSASSKTAIGVAHLMAKREGIRTIGLTSPGNMAFTESLGCWDELALYDDVGSLTVEPAVYIDISGSGTVKHAVHSRFGEQLGHSSTVGVTDWGDMGGGGEQPLPGPSPEMFFAPSQIMKRNEDWGREEMDRRLAEAFFAYSAWTDSWLSITRHEGGDAAADLWREMLPGKVDPTVGHIISLSG
ncbi:MAG: DUF2855 family protein [Acidimicrobiales bacterium]|jgi:hypothetical protein|nr:DUF2855 family protein [Acidimicrobiales bacterium]